MEKTHFPNFGIKWLPSCADVLGYLWYREGYESLPKSDWTEAENWIADHAERIEQWQRGD